MSVLNRLGSYGIRSFRIALMTTPMPQKSPTPIHKPRNGGQRMQQTTITPTKNIHLSIACFLQLPAIMQATITTMWQRNSEKGRPAPRHESTRNKRSEMIVMFPRSLMLAGTNRLLSERDLAGRSGG